MKAKELKQEEAKLRNEEYAKMTTQQKIDLLVKKGCTGKQLKKLLALLEKEKVILMANMITKMAGCIRWPNYQWIPSKTLFFPPPVTPRPSIPN